MFSLTRVLLSSMESDEISPTPTVPNGLVIKRRRYSISNNPLRSYYSNRMEGSSMDTGSSVSMPTSSIRQQTISWNFRELGAYEEDEAAVFPRERDEDQEQHFGGAAADDEEGSPITAIRIDPPPTLRSTSRPDASSLNNAAASGGWEEEEEVPLLEEEEHHAASLDFLFFPPVATPVNPTWLDILKTALFSLPAVMLAVMLTLLDAISYGIIVFPHSDPHLPSTAPQVTAVTHP
jgi:hypothetical protein